MGWHKTPTQQKNISPLIICGEIFLLPFLIYTQPEIAKNLLMYRYHTLTGARKKAKMNGYKGAMYAWESAATGEEVTPCWVVGLED
ncbi:MAG: hypothetical protein U9R53_07150, partial [Chloroflexota bacterium]|nr:hypothetical protein [Chloroflexota bacterium]